MRKQAVESVVGKRLLLNSNRLLTNLYISYIIHGDLYDYSKVKYGKSHRESVIIVCSRHGEFSQRPDHHLAGSGCNECRSEETSVRQAYDFEQFKRIADEEHLRRYSYDEKSYTGYRELRGIKVICQTMGLGFVQPQNHAHGKGLPKNAVNHMAKKK